MTHQELFDKAMAELVSAGAVLTGVSTITYGDTYRRTKFNFNGVSGAVTLDTRKPVICVKVGAQFGAQVRLLYQDSSAVAAFAASLHGLAQDVERLASECEIQAQDYRSRGQLYRAQLDVLAALNS